MAWASQIDLTQLRAEHNTLYQDTQKLMNVVNQISTDMASLRNDMKDAVAKQNEDIKDFKDRTDLNLVTMQLSVQKVVDEVQMKFNAQEAAIQGSAAEVLQQGADLREVHTRAAQDAEQQRGQLQELHPLHPQSKGAAYLGWLRVVATS